MDGGMGMDKGKAIESALLQIEKKFGKGAIMRLGERPHEISERSRRTALASMQQ